MRGRRRQRRRRGWPPSGVRRATTPSGRAPWQRWPALAGIRPAPTSSHGGWDSGCRSCSPHCSNSNSPGRSRGWRTAATSAAAGAKPASAPTSPTSRSELHGPSTGPYDGPPLGPTRGPTRATADSSAPDHRVPRPMSKALIIAEKPSVAADIARALGGFTRHGDYFESDDYVLSSAVGHLLEIKAPDDVEVKRGKWSFANLPVIPPHFDLNPIKKGEERPKLLRRLIQRKDVTRLINACDAGREGELIFRLIVQDAKAKQPIRRLWLQSMTQSAIRDAFQRLREDADLQPLADAARCRSEADWLVGINGTRAMTAFNSRDGGFYLTTVGRVQTPTLAIVVEREEKIKRFYSRPYFEVHAQFGVAAGPYAGRRHDARIRKGDDPEARAKRIWDRAQAEAIVAACQGQSGTVSEETKPSSQAAPLLF